MSRAGPGFLLIGAITLMMASGCAAAETPHPAREEQRSSAPNEPCNDLVDTRAAAPSPPGPTSSGGIYIGTGDTFFMGTQGRRWGDNVEFYAGAFHMKVGIHTLDSHPPRVSAIRSDGRATGTAEFAHDEAQRFPGTLPPGITFPTTGCWKVEARGTTGFATIEVNVQAPQPSPAS